MICDFIMTHQPMVIITEGGGLCNPAGKSSPAPVLLMAAQPEEDLLVKEVPGTADTVNAAELLQLRNSAGITQNESKGQLCGAYLQP